MRRISRELGENLSDDELQAIPNPALALALALTRNRNPKP